MPQIDLGKVVGDTGVSLRFRGEWNNVAEYVNGSNYIDLVTHNGSLWICDSTNTNQEPSISSEYWSVAAQGMEKKLIIYKSESGDFPLTGEEGILYVDDTISPALMYIWNGSAYIPAGGGGEIAAADVTYSNESSGLTAQTVQAAIDENAEAISGLNSRSFVFIDTQGIYQFLYEKWVRVTGVNFSDGIGTVEIELPENHAILRAIAQIEDASTVSLAACTAITSSNSVRLRCFLANSGEGYTGNTVGYINILICVGVISD